MARIFFSSGTLLVALFLGTVCFSEAAKKKASTTSKKDAVLPSESFDAWQGVLTSVPFGLQSCVEIRSTKDTEKITNSTGCGWKMPVFCDDKIQKDVAKKQAAKPPSKAEAAPPGYKFYPGAGYYKAHPEEMTFQEAKDICASEGTKTSLAIPSTAEEYAAVKNVMETDLPSGLYGLFLGITDMDVEGSYKTIFGQPLFTLPLVLWNCGEPNDAADGGQDCLGMGWQGADKLVDYECNVRLPFICEQPLAERATTCRP